MTKQPALGFAGLLRQLRAEAGLTQEELAEAAGLSPRSVSDLERGINRTARKDTAVLLSGARLSRPRWLPPVPDCFGGELSAGGEVKLGEHVREMGLHRPA